MTAGGVDRRALLANIRADMRWFPFFILAYIVLGLQLGIGNLASYRGAAPNLVLIVVVFIAGNAPRETALLSSFLLGLFQDTISIQPLGLHALAYGLAGLLVAGSRQVAYSDHPLTHFFLTLGVALLTAVVFWVHALIRPPGQSLGTGILSALYTAVLSIPLLWLLAKTKLLFGFRAARQRY